MNRRRPDDPLAGFTDVATIARGSTATVLRARDSTSGQLVAVKLLEGLGSTTPDRGSFEREARSLGAISRHPNVVTLHRAELAADGRPLLVLELCDGSLGDRLAEEGPLPVRSVVGVGVALAGALETAHRAGIVHGDVRPNNVLVTRYGEVALADFGVAALRGAATPTDDAHRWRPAEVAVRHAAPEVLAGAPVTPVSDVYSLASTLHEVLTGQAPFVTTGEEDAETVRRRALELPAPAATVPGVPPELRDLLLRTLTKDPTARPSTPLEFAQRLRAIELAAGWGPTPCRVGEADGSWRFPLDGTAEAARRGRAAATTGLPPLRLGAPPLGAVSRETRQERRTAPRGGAWFGPGVAETAQGAEGAPTAESPEAAPTAGSAPTADAPPTGSPTDLPPPPGTATSAPLPPPPAAAVPVDLPPPPDAAVPADLPPPTGTTAVTPDGPPDVMDGPTDAPVTSDRRTAPPADDPRAGRPGRARRRGRGKRRRRDDGGDAGAGARW